MQGLHNHCNFGLCCQQPQGLPQAMMETLLAVAVRPSDGRVGTVSLPLPNTQPLLFPCSVPRPHAGISLCRCPLLPPPSALLLPSPDSGCFPGPASSSPAISSFLYFPPFPWLRPLLRASPGHTNPRGPGMFLHVDVLQAVAWGSMQRAARVKIALSSVEIWLLVWCEVVSAWLIGCHACLRTAWFVLQDFWVWGGGQARVRFQAWLTWLLQYSAAWAISRDSHPSDHEAVWPSAEPLFCFLGTYNVSTPETTSSSLENTSSAYSLLN